MRPCTVLVGLAMALSSCSERSPGVADSKVTHAQVATKALACEAYAQWRMHNRAADTCPSSLGELMAYLNRRSTADPWGNPYRILCGDDKPAEAGSCLGIVSSGPDGVAGNADDVRSWD